MNDVQFDAKTNIGTTNNARKEKIKTGLLIASGVLLTGVTIFAAVQHKKLVGLKNTIRADEIRKEMAGWQKYLERPKLQLSVSNSLSDILCDNSWRKRCQVNLNRLQEELAKIEQSMNKSKDSALRNKLGIFA